MKKIVYNDGPPTLAILGVGVFTKGVPKEVEDNIADKLIVKGKFILVSEPKKNLKNEEV